MDTETTIRLEQIPPDIQSSNLRDFFATLGWMKFSILGTCLVLGISIPLTLFGPLSLHSRSEAIEAPEFVSLRVMLGSSPVTTAPALESNSESSLKAIAHDESSLEQFVSDSEIKVEERRFVFFGDSPRTYDPAFRLDKSTQEIAVRKVYTSDLSLASSKTHRYSAPKSPADFQGGFNYKNTSANIQLGEAYSSYLADVMDSPFTSKLMVVKGEQRQFLPGVVRGATAQPKR